MSTLDPEPYLRRAWLLTLASVLLVAWSAVYSASTRVRAQGDVTYPPGWNLISGPTGASLVGAVGPLYTLTAGDDDYAAVPAGTPLLGCNGYWAYFPTGGSITFSQDVPLNGVVRNGYGGDSCHRSMAVGRWATIGNPSATDPADVFGAITILTYDPAQGFVVSLKALLPVGRGALIQLDNLSAGHMDLFTDSLFPMPPMASASAPAYVTVMSRLGYQFDVPKDWHQAPATGNEVGTVNIRWQSPDGLLAAYVLVDTITTRPGATALTEVQGEVNFRRNTYLSVRVPLAPETEVIPGAESGARADVRYTDDFGVDRQDDIEVALRAGQSFTFVSTHKIGLPGSTLLPFHFRLLP
jgi:hypothetical protein